MSQDVIESLAGVDAVFDLATMPRLGLTRFRPLRRRAMALNWATSRVAMWKQMGAIEVEQWLSLNPAHVLVTRAAWSRRVS